MTLEFTQKIDRNVKFARDPSLSNKYVGWNNIGWQFFVLLAELFWKIVGIRLIASGIFPKNNKISCRIQ